MLGAIYLASFHFWMQADRPRIVLSTVAATTLSVLLFIWAERRGYFLNYWDRLFHLAVILDVLLEGLLIPVHDNYGFYLCAFGFSIVLGGYRAYGLRKQRLKVAVHCLV